MAQPRFHENAMRGLRRIWIESGEGQDFQRKCSVFLAREHNLIQAMQVCVPIVVLENALPRGVIAARWR